MPVATPALAAISGTATPVEAPRLEEIEGGVEQSDALIASGEFSCVLNYFYYRHVASVYE
ncbi:MAG: hypothetical protein WDM81_15780 [Rhizomicrobium sp.]